MAYVADSGTMEPFATGESPDEMFAERFSIPGAHMRRCSAKRLVWPEPCNHRA